MCRTGCLTQDHASWGECARAAKLQVQPGIMQVTERKAFDADLQAYSDARHEGIQPKSPDVKAVTQARQFADATGVGNPWQ